MRKPRLRRRSVRADFVEALELRLLYDRVQGVDVSQFQGTMNFTTTYNAGHRFAMVRASRSDTLPDIDAAANVPNAKAAGLLVGVYHRALPFSNTADTGAFRDPIVDADSFIATGGSWMGNGYIRPILDLENGTNKLTITPQGGYSSLSQWAVAWINRIKTVMGVTPIVYCNTNYAQSYFNSTVVTAAPDIWIANWEEVTYGDPVAGTPHPITGAINPPQGVWGTGSGWDFWQYSSTGTGSAHGATSTHIDLNVFNGSNINDVKRRFVTGAPTALPSGPSPASPSTNVSPFGLTLNWADTPGAVAYDVYLDNLTTPIATNLVTSQWTVSPGITGGAHSWKVVAKGVVADDDTHVEGPVWTFTASSLPLPGAPSSPNHNGDVVTVKPVTLDWADASNATSYDVYLGTNASPTYVDLAVSQVTGLTPVDGTRLWRVVSKNASGSTSGAQWSYTLDTTAPTASYGTQTPTAGNAFLDFTVTYADATTSVDATTFDGSDVTVTGPNSYSANASFISAAGNVVTYRIAAPGGTWNGTDNGTYTVSQNATQVKDVPGNYRALGTIGTFTASTTLPAPAVPSTPTPNGAVLTSSPITLDWADSANATSYDVYLGAGDVFYTNVTSSQLTGLTPGDGVQYWRIVAKNADVATTGPQWSYTLDTTAPTATYGGQVPSAGSAFLDFTVTYADATTSVDATTFDGSDLTVTGPNGYSANASFISAAGNVVTYRIAAPGGTWNLSDAGTYTVTQNATQVKDVPGNYRASGTVGTFSGNVAFAWMNGSVLNVEFDGTATPILLDTSGANVTATRNGNTLSFPGVTQILALGTGNGDNLQIHAPLTPPLTFNNGNGNDTVKVTGGTYTFASDLSPSLRNVSVTIDIGATGIFNAIQHLNGLTVNGSATANALLVTQSLAVGGVLDLKDNDLIIDYSAISPIGTWSGSAYSGVSGLIVSGQNGGGWDGFGLVTTMPDAVIGLTTLGTGEASDTLGLAGTDTAVFSGQTIDATSVLIKYTYAGDANLDGLIDGSDYAFIDFNISSPGAFAYFNGDFNYDGIIDGSDYGVIDFNIQTQGTIL